MGLEIKNAEAYGLEKLVCPISGTPLSVGMIEEHHSDNGKSYLKTGCLFSEESGFIYPVINGVPVMLTFETPLSRDFWEKYKAMIETLPVEVRLPDLDPMPGERSIQETFTEEWGGLGDDDVVFAYDEEEGYLLHKEVWLQMTPEETDAVETVLDVGCGFGKEARYLSRIFGNASVYAIDLNLAVIAAGISLLETGKITPVVASLYRMPFRDSSFDHVHCQGVIHHTFSTKRGFEALDRKVKEGGTLFVWVYAWEDSFGVPGFRGFLVHTYYFVSHRIFRPILSRAPAFVRNPVVHLITVMYHPLVKNRGRNKGRWKYVNTLHAVRDMFTPMYAHRHRFNEVYLWFQEKGYEELKFQSALRYQQLFGTRIIGIGFRGRKEHGPHNA